MLISIIVALAVTNIATLLWALKTRVPIKISKQMRSLQAAIAAFEIQGHTLLKIERIPEDAVFLRNPGGH
jgi:hypothetical protein